jgi:hypothetical protein
VRHQVEVSIEIQLAEKMAMVGEPQLGSMLPDRLT